MGIDDYASSHLIVDHLVKQGCKRIAHIGGFKHIRIFNNRIRGYKDALKKFKLPVDKELVMASSLTLQDGRIKMEQLLSLKNRPDALYVAGDYAALGAQQVLLENKIKIPEEIALVGFGNEPFTAMVSPSITSVHQYSGEIGKKAAAAFLAHTKKEFVQQSLNKIILNAKLIVRDSSNIFLY